MSAPLATRLVESNLRARHAAASAGNLLYLLAGQTVLANSDTMVVLDVHGAELR